LWKEKGGKFWQPEKVDGRGAGYRGEKEKRVNRRPYQTVDPRREISNFPPLLREKKKKKKRKKETRKSHTAIHFYLIV